jgi:hypothetical protein
MKIENLIKFGAILIGAGFVSGFVSRYVGLVFVILGSLIVVFTLTKVVFSAGASK